MKRVFAVLAMIISSTSCAASATAASDTIINVGSWLDKAPVSIGSNTQLNVTDFGNLPDGFQAGDPNGTSINVELNFSGNRADRIYANGGSVVNLSDGTVWRLLSANSGSEVNIAGRARLYQLGASGSTVSISSGTVNYTSVGEGSRVNITGGSLKEGFGAAEGSIVNMSGGNYGDNFSFAPGSQVAIAGAEFRLNGENVSGLDVLGDTRTIDLPVDVALSGTLADGTLFVLSRQDGDSIAAGTLTLRRAVVPDIDPTPILVPTNTSPSSVRNGQQLFLLDGGALPDYFKAGAGSRVSIEGGTTGYHIEAIRAQVTVTGGNLGSYFDAFYGTVVDILGGTIGARFDAMNGSVVRISDGEIREGFRAHAGSDVLITGGSFGEGFRALEDSAVEIRAGEFDDRFYVQDRARLTIAGGTFGDDYRAYDGSVINIRGTEFSLDGTPIEGLLSGAPAAIGDRDVILSGILADGSPFSFDLNSTDYERTPYGAWVPYDFFAAGAKLSVTLVPEPSSHVLAILSILIVHFFTTLVGRISVKA